MRHKPMNSIDQGIRQTWQQIGHDVCECDPDFDESNTHDVAEIVLDASHLESHGEVNEAELKSFNEMSYQDQLEYAMLVL